MMMIHPIYTPQPGKRVTEIIYVGTQRRFVRLGVHFLQNNAS
jgi:hypothetical protein